jgi:hypothetical protein
MKNIDFETKYLEKSALDGIRTHDLAVTRQAHFPGNLVAGVVVMNRVRLSSNPYFFFFF